MSPAPAHLMGEATSHRPHAESNLKASTMASPSTSRGPSRPRSPRPAVAGYSPSQWVRKPQPSISTSPRSAAAGYSHGERVVVAHGGQPGAEARRSEDDDDPGPPPAPGHGFDGHPPALDGPSPSAATGQRTRGRHSAAMKSLLERSASSRNGGIKGLTRPSIHHSQMSDTQDHTAAIPARQPSIAHRSSPSPSLTPSPAPSGYSSSYATAATSPSSERAATSAGASANGKGKGRISVDVGLRRVGTTNVSTIIATVPEAPSPYSARHMKAIERNGRFLLDFLLREDGLEGELDDGRRQEKLTALQSGESVCLFEQHSFWVAALHTRALSSSGLITRPNRVNLPSSTRAPAPSPPPLSSSKTPAPPPPNRHHD